MICRLAGLVVIAGCAAAPPRVQDPAARARDEADVIALSARQWQVIHDGDRAAAAAMLAPDFRYLSSSSNPERDRNKEQEMAANFEHPISEFHLANVRAVSVAPDVIVLHYRVDARTIWHDHEICPRSGATEAWVRRDGRWLLVTRTEYLMGATEPPPCPPASAP